MTVGGDMQAGGQTIQRDAVSAETLQLAAIDHRLKSAFLVIAGWARTLDDEWDRLTTEQRRHGIAAIRTRAEAMVAHAENLLAQLRPGALLPTVEQSTDVARVCQETANAYDASTPHQVAYCGSPSLHAAVPPDVLDQILEQLLENAVKFSPGASTIEVSVVDAAEGAMVIVRDQGPGLPADVDIFQPFTRGNHDVPGTGIGLSMVSSLVASVGGTVTAVNLSSGGSQFAVLLPKATAA